TVGVERARVRRGASAPAPARTQFRPRSVRERSAPCSRYLSWDPTRTPIRRTWPCCHAVHVAIVVYLIGPSSVGKSTAAAYLQDAGEATWRDLDAWMQQAGFPSRDWPPIAPLFAELEASADTLP